MDNLAIAHINCHMPCIANQVASLGIGVTHFLPHGTLGIGIAGDVDAKMRIHIAGKPAAVSPGIRVFAPPYIRVPHKRQSIIDHAAAAYPSAESRVLVPSSAAGIPAI